VIVHRMRIHPAIQNLFGRSTGFGKSSVYHFDPE